MTVRILRVTVGASLLALLLVPSCAAGQSQQKHAVQPGFSISTGAYRISFALKNGKVTVALRGKKAGLSISEFAGGKKLDLLYSVTSLHRSGSTVTLKGKGSWAAFSFVLSLNPSLPGLLHFSLTVTPFKHAPSILR